MHHSHAFLLIIGVYTIVPKIRHIKIRLSTRYYAVEFLIIEQGQPFRPNYFLETLSEIPRFLLQLIVTLKITIRHDKLQLVLSELKNQYLFTKVFYSYFDLFYFDGNNRFMYFFIPLGCWSRITKVCCKSYSYYPLILLKSTRLL